MKKTFFPSWTTIWRTRCCSALSARTSYEPFSCLFGEAIVTWGVKKESRVLRRLLPSSCFPNASRPPVDLRFLAFVVVVLSTVLRDISDCAPGVQTGTAREPVERGEKKGGGRGRKWTGSSHSMPRTVGSRDALPSLSRPAHVLSVLGGIQSDKMKWHEYRAPSADVACSVGQLHSQLAPIPIE